VLKLAIEKDPNNAVLYSVQGSLFDKKASAATDAKDEVAMNTWYDKAEQAYKSSIEKDPTYFDAYFNIGVLYNNRAAFEYEKCNAIKSDTEYMKCKKVADDIYLKAVPYFEKAHEMDGGCPDHATTDEAVREDGRSGEVRGHQGQAG
jgi:tetratricopeptide (TPR) repeat protein